MTDELGLISREFYSQDGKQYVREEWDLTVPGCPVWAVDHSKWGTGGSVRNPDVVRVIRTRRLS